MTFPSRFRSIVVFFLVSLSIVCQSCRSPESIRAENGVIDLSAHSFEKNGPAALRGEWKLVLPDGSGGVIQVPGNWKGQKIGQDRMSASGFASFSLRILLPESASPLMLRVGELGTASKIIVNGVAVAQNGVPSETPAGTVSSVKVRYLGLPAQGKQMDLEIIIANFDDPNGGGIWGPVTIGTVEQISYSQNTALIRESLLSGIFLIVALFYLAIFLYRRSDLTSLLFTLICAAFFLRQISTGEKILQLIAPAVSWRMLVRVEYSSLYALAPLYVFFFDLLFPNFAGKIVPRIFMAAGAIFFLMALTLPVSAFIATLHFCQGYWLCVFCLIYFVLLRAWRSKRDDGILFLLSFSLLLLAGLNDILLTRFFVPTVSLVTPAQAIFIFFQTLVLSRRFAREYRESRNLSELNAHLNELDAAKTRFFTASSHELRTPVTLITTPIEAIISGRYGETIPRDAPVFALVKRNCERLKRLADELLDFLRFDSGAVRISPRAVDLARFAEGYVPLFAPDAAVKNVRLESDLSSGKIAMIDPVLFETVILNLLSNALKHTPAGGAVTIRVFGDAGAVSLSVSDTGPGIPEAQIPVLFDRFRSASALKSTDYSGFGIGLPLAAEIVKTLGGTISVASDAASGACFVVSFPSFAGSPDTLEPPSTARVAEYVGLDRPSVGGVRTRVLVVDDNRDVLELLEETLSADFTVHVAASAAEALSLIERGLRPQVIVSDVMMPAMDGFGFREKLQSVDGCAGIPFLFLSARADQESRNAGLARGAVDYIKKPFDIDELSAKILSLAALSRAGREDLERKVIEALRKDGAPTVAFDWRSRASSLGMTERDLAVLELVIRGMGDKEIAAELSCSSRTVSNRISSLLKRTGTQSRTELVSFMTQAK